VFGYSVVHDTDAVRRLVAVCKQDDYFYPDLSAYEHLQLFAGLRGVPGHKMAETVEKWLDLATVQDHYTSSFSGGMKRRLSLACSTIGDRPVSKFRVSPSCRCFHWNINLTESSTVCINSCSGRTDDWYGPGEPPVCLEAH
jgi:hypothetical protein